MCTGRVKTKHRRRFLAVIMYMDVYGNTMNSTGSLGYIYIYVCI